MPDQERRDPALRETLRRHNEYNRRLFELIQADALQGKGVVISLTDCYRETDYGEPVNALKSYILSPFTEIRHVHAVLESIWKARREVVWP
jgi:L-2,4-diaminobutyrate decarboxylase